MMNLFPCRTTVAAMLSALALGTSHGAAELDVRRDATVEAVAKVRHSVVNIRTAALVRSRAPDDWFEEFFNFHHPYQRRQARPAFSLGTGVIVDEDGYILTNNHVIQRGERSEILVLVGTNEYKAELMAFAESSDIALLKINPREKLQPIQFAKDDDLLLGETVIALGNPFGLGLSVSRGILSSTARRPQPEQGILTHQDWLQTDAAINPGNSGGPLINLKGELIGINVAVYRQDNAQGIGFAIPIKHVGEAISEMFTPENRGFWFGARIRSTEGNLSVASVQTGSPAEKAGLRPGDRILKIGGRTPRNFIQFMVELIKQSDRPVSLTIAREGSQRTVSLSVIRQETVFNSELVRQKVGLALQEVSPEFAELLGVNPGQGLVITAVDRDSPAATAGMQPGFLILSINGREVNDVIAAAKLLYERRKGDTVTMEILAVQRRGFLISYIPGTARLRVR